MAKRVKRRTAARTPTKARGSPKGRKRTAAPRAAARTTSRSNGSPAANAGAGSAAKPVTLPIYQVDAFTSRRFHGNPAAVVMLEKKWLATELMQQIASENNVSETAFLLPKGKKGNDPRFGLRWFTPAVEMDLCGHATLAAAHVLWSHEGVKGDRIVFDSASGPLPVERAGDLLVLDFPRRAGTPCAVSDELCFALGQEPAEAYKSHGRIMAVFENRRDVYGLKPDMEKVAALGGVGVIVTAPGSGHDFVSRFFAPQAGVDEDPVTGSAHSTLTPYWARRLKKDVLRGHQVSKRGGELWCEDAGQRVRIGGHAVTFLVGRISV
ncbi:MAG: PhzF family phenazine biosynthesis protein [Phycisphaerales bacterium]